MKPRTREKKLLLAAALSGLCLVLALLIAVGVWSGDAVRLGLPRSADSYGAAMLLQTHSAQYSVTLGSTAQTVADALKEGSLNAALLPADIAASLNSTDYHIHAVLSYTTLIAVSRKPLARLDELNGRTLTLSRAQQGSKAESMLKYLLSQADVSAEIVYSDDLAAAAQGEYDVMLASLDELHPVLTADASAGACFSLCAQWRALLGSEPPAGLCLVVRADYDLVSGGAYRAFEKGLKDSVAYADEKRKKTVAMAVAGGIAHSEAEADALIDYCTFRFLQDSDMDSAIAAFRAL